MRQDRVGDRQDGWVPEADTFGKRLAMLRNEMGLTQREAAAACGIDDGSWSNWEHGRRPRRMDEVVGIIADTFRCDRNWLMWGNPPRDQADPRSRWNDDRAGSDASSPSALLAPAA